MADVTGWIGAGLLLIGYGLSGSGLLLSSSTLLHMLNFIGACLLATSATMHEAGPLIALNVLWAIFAAFAIVRNYFSPLSNNFIISPLVDLIWKDLPRSVIEYNQLAEMHRKNQNEKNSDKDLLTHLYACLSIIDSKSGALLTTNSLWLAVISILLSSDTLGFNKTSPWELLAALSSFVFISISAGLALFTIYIRWSTPSELADPIRLACNLLRIRAQRTAYFRLAAVLCAIGSLILVSFVCYKFLIHLAKLQWI